MDGSLGDCFQHWFAPGQTCSRGFSTRANLVQICRSVQCPKPTWLLNYAKTFRECYLCSALHDNIGGDHHHHHHHHHNNNNNNSNFFPRRERKRLRSFLNKKLFFCQSSICQKLVKFPDQSIGDLHLKLNTSFEAKRDHYIIHDNDVLP